MLASLGRLFYPLALIGGIVFCPVGLAESSVSQGIIWVALQGEAKEGDGVGHIFGLVVMLQIAPATQVIIVGGRLLRTMGHQRVCSFPPSCKPSMLTTFSTTRSSTPNTSALSAVMVSAESCRMLLRLRDYT